MLAEMKFYAQNLAPNGVLLLSGFYEKDIPDLVLAGEQHGLIETSQDERESWASLVLRKSR